jgi:hypothetical protein
MVVWSIGMPVKGVWATVGYEKLGGPQWFLQKWKILVGGPNDEIWCQTTWWKQLQEVRDVVRA